MSHGYRPITASDCRSAVFLSNIDNMRNSTISGYEELRDGCGETGFFCDFDIMVCVKDNSSTVDLIDRNDMSDIFNQVVMVGTVQSLKGLAIKLLACIKRNQR
jgi:hypothetical protein